MLYKLGHVHTSVEQVGYHGYGGNGHVMIKCSTLERRQEKELGVSPKAQIYHRALFLSAEMQYNA